MSELIRLSGVVRHYEWGSRTAIPRLLGQAPDGRPAAELWLGAHPDDPAFAPELGVGLDALVAADPPGMLGTAVAGRFGGALPFLLKVLAADRALSLQVHPTLAQARAGYAAEEARGVPHDAPERNYKDPNHKPELLCALTEFDALCGFRPAEQTAALFDALRVPELVRYREVLCGPDGLRTAFTSLITAPDPAPLVDAVVAGARQLAEGPWRDAARAVLTCAGDFPGDIGAVLSLLLNSIRLQPGEAIFLGAGNVHAYLRGVGVEIMANSDNVLRCGLTPKHVDTPELLRVTEFVELPEPRWPPDRDGPAQTFRAPVPDFELTRMSLDGAATLPAAGARILLCTEGDVTVNGPDGAVVPLFRGQAVFAAAGLRLWLHGAGVVFAASTP